ncbi:hypothetical protein [Nocardia aurea]|uniref:Uncharacterized protein n=1 Tax=Nocardia aurea TaxID=2144174 RepID=A0ABV3FRL8_9NOCA
MELLVILVLVLLVAAVVGYRKIKGTDKNLDMSTGNPPANDDKD